MSENEEKILQQELIRENYENRNFNYITSAKKSNSGPPQSAFAPIKADKQSNENANSEKNK